MSGRQETTADVLRRGWCVVNMDRSRRRGHAWETVHSTRRDAVASAVADWSEAARLTGQKAPTWAGLRKQGFEVVRVAVVGALPA
jgi:hypothetical protein